MVQARRRIVDQLNDVMQGIEAEQQANPGMVQRGLLAKLLATRDEDQSRLSREDIVDNVLTLVFAGSDTTAATAISIWKAMSLSPNLYHDLQQLERATPKNSKESLSDLDQVLLNVIDRVLQSYPSAPFTFRTSAHELSVGAYTVPQNWLVVYGLAGSLLDPHQIASETALMVEEFTSSSTKIPTTSYAFGVGPRKCPGRFLATAELFTFLKQLLQYNWQLDPDQYLKQVYNPGFFPVDGFRAKLLS